MATNTDINLQELVESLHKSNDTIRQLNELLMQSDSRYRNMERILRWIGVIAICLVLTVSFISFDFVNKAQATAEDSNTVSPVPQPALSNQQLFVNLDDKTKMELQSTLGEMLQFFKHLNSLVGNMDSLTTYLSPTAPDDQVTLTKVAEKSGLLNKEALSELSNVTKNGGGVLSYLMIEATKGLGRIDNMEELVKTVLAEMHTMNISMYEMNMKMGLMTHDIDSTMGRMGRWMPGGSW